MSNDVTPKQAVDNIRRALVSAMDVLRAALQATSEESVRFATEGLRKALTSLEGTADRAVNFTSSRSQAVDAGQVLKKSSNESVYAEARQLLNKAQAVNDELGRTASVTPAQQRSGPAK